MIRVRVEYVAFLRSIVGRTEEEVRLPEGSTVRTLLQTLVAQYGDDFGTFVMGEGWGRNSTRVFLDGAELQPSDDLLDAALSDGSQVRLVVIAPLSGGS